MFKNIFSQKCDDIEISDGSQEDDDMETSSVNQTQVMILVLHLNQWKPSKCYKQATLKMIDHINLFEVCLIKINKSYTIEMCRVQWVGIKHSYF